MKRRGVVSIFSRYLFLEGFYPLLFSLLGLTVFFISGMLYDMTDMLISRRVSFFVVLQIFFCRLPWVWVMVLPISALFATVFSLGRLMKDNEIDSMRMGGYGIFKIYLPFIILGVLVSATTYWMNEKIVPWANYRTTELFSQVVKIGREEQMKEDVFFKEADGRLFYIRQVDWGKQNLYDVMIYEGDLGSTSSRIITAAKATYLKDEWKLEAGVINTRDEKGFITAQEKFEKYVIQVENGAHYFFEESKSPEEMSRAELAEEIKVFSEKGLRTNTLEVSYHVKLAKSFASLILVIVGVPLSLRNRKGRIVGVLMTLVLTFAYYILQSLGQSLGTSGFISPFLAAWLPNLFFVVIGIGLLVMEEYFVN